MEGLPRDRRLEAIIEFSYKKANIVNNEMSTKFQGIGNDRHVILVLKAFWKLFCSEKHKATDKGGEAFVEFMTLTLDSDCGYWFNELIGTMGQLVSSISTDPDGDKAFARRVFEQLTTSHPEKYNKVLGELKWILN